MTHFSFDTPFDLTHVSTGTTGRKCMAGDQGRASLCDMAGKKHGKADLKGVQIQPAGIL